MRREVSELVGLSVNAVDVALLETLFASLGVGIYATDWTAGQGGIVLAANPRCGELLGYSVEELIGSKIHDLIHYQTLDGDPLAATDCALFAVADGAAALSGEDTFWRSDGTPLPVSWSGVPLVREGIVVGTVITFTDDTERRLHRMEREMLAAQEHATAVALQRALMTAPPTLQGLELSVRYLPAAQGAEIGGDWYDAFIGPDGDTILIVGDVVGHDVKAAAAMGQLRGLLRGIAYAVSEPPARTLSRVEQTADGLDVSTLATLVLARMGPPDAGGTRGLQWSNAGHPPPLVVDAEGSVRWLDPEPDLLLGVDQTTTRATHTARLAPGDTLLLFTDGLVERRDAPLSTGLDGLARHAAALVGQPLDHLLDHLVDELADTDDDVALLAIRLT